MLSEDFGQWVTWKDYERDYCECDTIGLNFRIGEAPHLFVEADLPPVRKLLRGGSSTD
jgi:hypothetical protein